MIGRLNDLTVERDGAAPRRRPHLAGREKGLFTDDDTLRKFELLDVDRTANGTLLLGYRAAT